MILDFLSEAISQLIEKILDRCLHNKAAAVDKLSWIRQK